MHESSDLLHIMTDESISLKNRSSAIHGHHQVTVIVPAAASADNREAAKNKKSDAGFLNVGTKLAIERISEFFAEKPNVDVILGVIDPDKKIFELRPFESLKVVGVGPTLSACETILRLLDYAEGEWCLINPITAVPGSHLTAEGAIYFGQDQIPKENWAAMTLHGIEKPIFHSKKEDVTLGLPSFPFTGRIYARKVDIREAIGRLAEEQKSDLVYLAKSLFDSNYASIRYERWLDAGHDATYADSKLLAISSRFFNSLYYDTRTNTIRKCSKEKTKVELEGRFFAECPATTRRYFPLVINSSDKGDYWELELEYIGYPSLAEVFLYGDIGPNSWRRIIESLGRAFDAFYLSQSVNRGNIAWLYSEKTSQRQQALEGMLRDSPTHCLRALYEQKFKVNGIELPTLKEGFEIIARNLKEIEKNRPLHVGHGDLCFNNILVDPVFGALKLIDPKAALDASTGKCGLMDPLYDLAKLNHSFLGLYDSVVNNLYTLTKASPLELTFKIYTPASFQYISEVFQNEFLLERVDEGACTLITANLFLSMLPLHRDDPDRMAALAIIGLTLLVHGNINPFFLKQ